MQTDRNFPEFCIGFKAKASWSKSIHFQSIKRGLSNLPFWGNYCNAFNCWIGHHKEITHSGQILQRRKCELHGKRGSRTCSPRSQRFVTPWRSASKPYRLFPERTQLTAINVKKMFPLTYIESKKCHADWIRDLRPHIRQVNILDLRYELIRHSFRRNHSRAYDHVRNRLESNSWKHL